jgi:demethylmenaquinone methyltransferase/2-methoxy-6-polyprenyl-1,4-benzoquinol methylase
MSTDRNRGIQEQLDYYRARSGEYDQWWYREGRYDRGATENERCFKDSAEVGSALQAFRPSGRILELACGTGIWSEKLLAFASELTLVDGSREMLDRAKQRLGRAGVTYVQADLFEWNPEVEFDTVFFSFWLSHVPPSRFSAFWHLVSRCLAPGGRVFFIDSQYEQASTAVDHRLPEKEVMQLQRRLNDGRAFQIYKIFYDPSSLEQQLGELGWNIRVNMTDSFFIYGQGERKVE